MRDLLGPEEWLVVEEGFDPARANVVETLHTVGNGFLGTRGTLEEGHRGELSGTFLAGVYDDHDSPVIDLVNAPDWLATTVEVDGVRLSVHNFTVVEHERVLDLRSGLAYRRTVFADEQGRRTRVETLRCASVADRQVCTLRIEVTPENHAPEILITTGIDGDRRNLERIPVYPDGTTFDPEVRWEKWSRTKHLRRVAHAVTEDVGYLEMRTVNSQVTLGYAAAVSSEPAAEDDRFRIDDEQVFWLGRYPSEQGRTIRLDKTVAISTSRGTGSAAAVREDALAVLGRAREAGFDALVAASREVWDGWWNDCDCEIVGDATLTHAIRFGIYHLLIAANEADPTVNIGAKSLSGEGYRGHVFWDTEILMLPFYIFTRPATARSLLGYRHHTLPGARGNAERDGHRGARFAWESADTGREECPIFTPEGTFRFWARDEELHVSADVAYGIMRYAEATGDTEFLASLGAQVVFETSRFWMDRLEAATDGSGYVLKQVMGPDEFHSHVDNNAFTNLMVRWHLQTAADLYQRLQVSDPGALAELSEVLGLQAAEVEQWRATAEGIAPARSRDGVIEQFDGYFDRLDVPITDWDRNSMPRYPEGYHHFNCEDTMLLKQPDVVMAMYLLPDDFDLETKRSNYEFYEARTLHKSSLSPSIHAIMGIEVGDTSRAEQYFARSALVDLTDNQGNTAEGMHIASAGGTWQTLVCGFGGLRVVHGQPSFNPWLPDSWDAIRFRLQWRGVRITVDLERDRISFATDPGGGDLSISVQGRPVTLTGGETTVVPLRDPARV